MEEGLDFWIHVTPRARREVVGGRRGDALQVSVTAPPTRGEANAACVRALADAFGVRPRQVEIRSGARARRKRVRLSGQSRALAERLETLAGPL
jgi:hypothetical protein